MITSISIITSYLVTNIQKKGPNWGKFERFFLRRFSVAKLIWLYLLHLYLLAGGWTQDMEAKVGLIVGAQRRSWLSLSPARSAYTTLQISFFFEGLSAIFNYPHKTAVLINNFKNYIMPHQSFDHHTSGTCNQGCRRALLSTPFPSVTTAPRISNVRLGIFNNNQTHSIRL